MNPPSLRAAVMEAAKQELCAFKDDKCPWAERNEELLAPLIERLADVAEAADKFMTVPHGTIATKKAYGDMVAARASLRAQLGMGGG